MTSIISLPKSFSTPQSLHATALRFKALRLHALKSAPYAFSSTHAEEAAFGDETWHSRLTSPDSKTFVAVAPSTADNDDRQWLGLITVIGPFSPLQAAIFLHADDAARKFLAAEPTTSCYVLVSFFVDASARGTGLGTGLITAAQEYIASSSPVGAVAALSAYKSNVSALCLYDRLGFKPIGHDKRGDELVLAKATDKDYKCN
ncbi:uncharacterized protein V1518DRAFT_424064 [Limtongia smithiae]|uniref:uncharacterized protein n=1 Tax=Limtongia smithiae TaxID=1125753 RepID=UPI0034CF8026